MKSIWPKTAAAAVLLSPLALSSPAHADPFVHPGDVLLRSDLQLLNDTGALNIPMMAWPLSLGDVSNAINRIESTNSDPAITAALSRVRERLRWESTTDNWRFDFGGSVAENPRVIRSFENTPREEAEAFARLNWLGERFAINLQARVVANPFDGDKLRPDGTYVGVALGNWMLSAGWQERWWGPGNTASLILSSNARPSPGITLQRNNSDPFKTKWLGWLGPWRFTAFMNLLDDDREVEDALLFGARFSFRPIKGLDIAITRTAQWCGQDRSCDLGTFSDLILGNDNRGINVDPEDEPGNQLAAFEIRWVLPKEIPMALHVQWVAEDGRNRKRFPGSWLRQVGAEVWGQLGGLQHRTYIELSDTGCRLGGIGSSERKVNCAYNHGTFRTGYRYQGRVLGHGIDGDGLSYSVGSTLVQSSGHSWNVLLRYMEINQFGPPNPAHSLSATPQDIADIQISHDRITAFGSFKLGLAFSRLNDELTETNSNDVSAFVQWSSR